VEVCVNLIYYAVTNQQRKQSGRYILQIVGCSDWCCRPALSDLFNEDLHLDDHEHSHRDQRLLACDEFFRRIILDEEVLVGEKEFPVQLNKGGSIRERITYGMVKSA
jgi:hypothetical protein